MPYHFPVHPKLQSLELQLYLVAPELEEHLDETGQLVAGTSPIADEHVDLLAENGHLNVVDVLTVWKCKRRDGVRRTNKQKSSCGIMPKKSLNTNLIFKP